MEVYVFKTNIENQNMVSQLNNVLSQQQNINQWTVDTEDCDNVLRIVSSKKIPEINLIKLVHQVGFQCEPLL